MNTLAGILHKMDIFVAYESMPSIVDIHQKSYEAINAFKRGDTVYVNNVEILNYDSTGFLGRDKIIPYSIVTSVTTIS